MMHDEVYNKGENSVVHTRNIDLSRFFCGAAGAIKALRGGPDEVALAFLDRISGFSAPVFCSPSAETSHAPKHRWDGFAGAAGRGKAGALLLPVLSTLSPHESGINLAHMANCRQGVADSRTRQDHCNAMRAAAYRVRTVGV